TGLRVTGLRVIIEVAKIMITSKGKATHRVAKRLISQLRLNQLTAILPSSVKYGS
ncbi:MAG: hypothetical protein ACI854_002366, partial [Arenicella sp.]